MTVTTARSLVPGSLLTGSAAVYYTAGTGVRAIIKSASVINTTGGTVAVTVYKVPNAGSPGASNTIISARNVAAGETYNCPELVNHVVDSGGTLQAFGSGLTFAVSGAEVVS